eukprot:SAG11_NODE_20523_length_443_cov_1.412791_1_plen_112_part_10
MKVLPLVREEVWYRGSFGKVLFTWSIVVICWAVLVTIYCSGSAQTADSIDLLHTNWRQPANYYFALSVVIGTLLSLWMALGEWWLLAAATGMWYLTKNALPPIPTEAVDNRP